MIDAKYILNVAKSEINRQIEKIEKELVNKAEILSNGNEVNVSLKDSLNKDFLISEFENRGFNVTFHSSLNFHSQSADYYLSLSIKKDLLNK